MATKFQSFVNKHILINVASQVLASNVATRYVSFNNGSTEGKIKLYRFLRNIDGVSKPGNMFIGIELKPEEGAPVATLPVAALPVATPSVNTTTPQMSEYQKEKLRLKQIEIENQKEIENKKAEIENKKAEIENKKVEMQKELKQMDIEQQKELKQMDQDFYREENNKNRQMYSNKVADRYNKYLDFELYGSPACQIISSKSFACNISYRVFSSTNSIEYESIVKDTVDKYSEPTTIVKNNKAIEEFAVPITKAKDMISEIESLLSNNDVSNVNFDPIYERIEVIPEIATRDNDRFIETTYAKALAIQDSVKNHTFRNKRSYLRPENKRGIHSNGVDEVVSCYCCGYRDILDSPKFERGHNIPKSAGGDVSDSNIYIICSLCNRGMSNNFTIEEYKVKLYLESIKTNKPDKIDNDT